MVEYTSSLNNIFLSLADGTRRDILRLLGLNKTMSVGEIAGHFQLTFAGVSKHLKVLEAAQLISKQRIGKNQIVSLAPCGFLEADDYIKQYEKLWNERFDRLEVFLRESEG